MPWRPFLYLPCAAGFAFAAGWSADVLLKTTALHWAWRRLLVGLAAGVAAAPLVLLACGL